ncbi:MAG: thiamine pyrophosphate-binding protein [Nitrospirota bacterium]
MAKLVLAEGRIKPLKNLTLENIDTDEAAQNITVAQAIRHYLEQIGVEYVFGVPGGAIVVLFDELCKSDQLKVVPTKTESGAVFMATAYARVSGNLGVCITTSGPGATNLVTGLSSAKLDGLPVLAITGQTSFAQRGYGASQEMSEYTIDIIPLLSQVTKKSLPLTNPELICKVLNELVHIALTPRCGPVAINLPIDLSMAPFSYSKRVEFGWSLRKSDYNLNKETVEKALYYFKRARSPLILAGYGIEQAGAEDYLFKLATKLGVPVITTPKAKGIFPEDHPLSLGSFGYGGSRQSIEYIKSGMVDLLLALGTRFSEVSTNGWMPELYDISQILHVDIDPGAVDYRFKSLYSVVMDVKVFLTEFHRRLEHACPNFQISIKEFKETTPRYIEETKQCSDSVPIKPQRLLKDIQKSFPEDTAYFIDIGAIHLWANHYMTINRPKSYFIAYGLASMASAVAGVIGGKLALGKKPVVCLTGDGSFLMNGCEINTARLLELPIVWVILNDSRWGVVYYGMRSFGLETNPTEFPPVDFALLASSFGCNGIRIDSPGQINQKLVQGFLSLDVPTILDVLIDRDETPPILGRVKSLQHGKASNG